MVLATRPRQDDFKHHLPDSADVSVVRGDRLLRLRTTCATREEAERTFLLFTFAYGLGAARPLHVGQAPGGEVWEASVTAIGRDARVCMSCDRYVPIFDCCVDANHICMACMLAGRGPQTPPVPFATPRERVMRPPTISATPAILTASLAAPATAGVPDGSGARAAATMSPGDSRTRSARRRRGGRRRGGRGAGTTNSTAA